MDKSEMKDALRQAQTREQAIQGATIVGFILTCIFAYYSPGWMWVHGPETGWSNVIRFFVIDFLITIALWWVVDKQYQEQA